MGRHGLDWSSSGYEQAAGDCESGKEITGSTNEGNILTILETVNFSESTLLHGVSLVSYLCCALQCHVRLERDHSGSPETQFPARARGPLAAFLERKVFGSLHLHLIHNSASLRFVEDHRQTIR
jgi:hypothetical protein